MKVFRLLHPILLTLGIWMYVIPAGIAAESQHHDHPVLSGTADQERFAVEMDLGMAKMMTDMHSPGMTGDADVDFLAMMIPHHEGAVDMARLVLIYGKDPLVRQLAEEIIASQQAEISAMRGRLEILRKGEDQDPGGFPAVHGTRGIGQLTQDD